MPLVRPPSKRPDANKVAHLPTSLIPREHAFYLSRRVAWLERRIASKEASPTGATFEQGELDALIYCMGALHMHLSKPTPSTPGTPSTPSTPNPPKKPTATSVEVWVPGQNKGTKDAR